MLHIKNFVLCLCQNWYILCFMYQRMCLTVMFMISQLWTAVIYNYYQPNSPMLLHLQIDVLGFGGSVGSLCKVASLSCARLCWWRITSIKILSLTLSAPHTCWSDNLIHFGLSSHIRWQAWHVPRNVIPSHPPPHVWMVKGELYVKGIPVLLKFTTGKCQWLVSLWAFSHLVEKSWSDRYC